MATVSDLPDPLKQGNTTDGCETKMGLMETPNGDDIDKNFMTQQIELGQRNIEMEKSDEGCMNIDDNDEVMKWLKETVKLPEYYNIFKQNGLTSLDLIAKIKTLQNLEYIGIKAKGHQIVIMNCIDELDGKYVKRQSTKFSETPFL